MNHAMLMQFLDSPEIQISMTIIAVLIGAAIALFIIERMPATPHNWFAWHPVQLGAVGGPWVWLRVVVRVPGPVTIYQRKHRHTWHYMGDSRTCPCGRHEVYTQDAFGGHWDEA